MLQRLLPALVMICLAAQAMGSLSAWSSSNVLCWPWHVGEPSLWELSMGPPSSHIVINDRPIYDLGKVDVNAMVQKLEHALNTYRNHHATCPHPDYKLGLLLDLGVLCYQSRRYQSAKSYFVEAIQERRNTPDSNCDIAQYYWCLGQVCQAEADYQGALDALQEALRLLQEDQAQGALLIPATYMRMSRVYAEYGKPEVAKDCIAKALALEPHQLDCKWSNTKVDSINMILAHSKSILAEVEKEERERELLAKQEAERLARIQAEQQKELDEDDQLMTDASVLPGYGTIGGKVVVPIHGAASFITTDGQLTRPQTSGGDRPRLSDKESKKDESQPKQEKALPLRVTITLCRTALRNGLISLLLNEAQKTYERPIEMLGMEWPKLEIEAEDLVLKMEREALRYQVKRKNSPTRITSDENGEFQFVDIPKGRFYLFTVVVSQGEVMYWLLPIVVDKKSNYQDILADNVARQIWKSDRQLHE